MKFVFSQRFMMYAVMIIQLLNVCYGNIANVWRFRDVCATELICQRGKRTHLGAF
jgi:hypothetical protein